VTEHIIAKVLLERAAHAGNDPPILDASSGSYRLPYSAVYKRIVGLVGWFVATFWLVAVSLEMNPTGRLLFIAIAASITILAYPTLVDVLMYEVQFTELGLARRNRILRRRGEIAWEQVTRVEYLGLNQRLVFKTATGRKIQVSRFRIGTNELCRFAAKRLRPDPAADLNVIVVLHIDPRSPV
jgi:hypothetical protein